MLRVAINGYGRIGRIVHRQFLTRFPDQVEVIAINASSDAVMRAYLLKYDSLHGRFHGEVSVKGDDLIVNNKCVRVIRQSSPEKCPWKDMDIDIVIESTGNFDTRLGVNAHLAAGAKRIIVTAPMKDDTPTFVLGVNEEKLTKDMLVVSNASCTTNCVAPVIKVMDESFGVEHLLVGSVHAFTASQNLLDNKAKEGGELRRSRAVTLSIIPTKTGAVKACANIFPHLKGRIDGMAFRVPIPTVSCAYMVFDLRSKTHADAIHAALEKSATDKRMHGILSVSHDECVSIDFQTDHHSSIVDAPSTKVVDGTMAQILAWYDNEWGYAMRVSEMALRVGAFL